MVDAHDPLTGEKIAASINSVSRRDFLDGRYRAMSIADLFPEGFTRWLGNNLTGDEALRNIKGPRLAASGRVPVADAQQFPTTPLGSVSWWKPSAEVCFPAANSIDCALNPTSSTVVVDPQIVWEQQKFMIAMTLQYLPENAQQRWLEQMGIWELGADTDPGFASRIELHLPEGKTSIAHTYGRESVLGKSVQRGSAASRRACSSRRMNCSRRPMSRFLAPIWMATPSPTGSFPSTPTARRW
jgi:hypothetical protein